MQFYFITSALIVIILLQMIRVFVSIFRYIKNKFLLNQSLNFNFPNFFYKLTIHIHMPVYKKKFLFIRSHSNKLVPIGIMKRFFLLTVLVTNIEGFQIGLVDRLRISHRLINWLKLLTG